MLVPVFRSEPHVVIATDGSADLGLASLAIHVPQVECSLNGDVLSEDQSPYRAEVDAIFHALCSCWLAVQQCALFQPHTFT